VFAASERGRLHLGPDGKVMHAELQVGSPVGLNLHIEDCDAVFKKATESGAKVTMPILCSAIACSGSGGGGSGASPLLALVLTPGCGTVTLAVSSSYRSPSPYGYTNGASAQYRVERSTDAGSTWVTVATLLTGAASASITLTGQPAQALQFRVFGGDGAHETGPSAVASTTPLAVPDAPTGVSALAGSSRATVIWQLPRSDHGSPFTQTILADQVGAGNRFQFPAAATETGAVVGDEIHPLLSDQDARTTWSFRVSATNQCGTATSDPSPAIQTLPWNQTPTPFPLGTTLTEMGSVQFATTHYLIGGFDDDLQERSVTLSTTLDRTNPVDGRVVPWQGPGLPRSRTSWAIRSSPISRATD
jgi:hypothetical protein